MARLLQIDIDRKIAELYLSDNEAWQVSYVENHPQQWHVVGAGFTAAYTTIDELIAAPNLSRLVKCGARGIIALLQIEREEGAASGTTNAR